MGWQYLYSFSAGVLLGLAVPIVYETAWPHPPVSHASHFALDPRVEAISREITRLQGEVAKVDRRLADQFIPPQNLPIPVRPELLPVLVGPEIENR